MASKVCPHCQTVLTSTASYNRHLTTCKLNPDNQQQDEPVTQPDSVNDDTPADIKIDVKPEDVEPHNYRCDSCKNPVTKGQDACPNCGESLEWAGL